MKRAVVIIMTTILAVLFPLNAIAMDISSDNIMVRVMVMDDKDSVCIAIKSCYKVMAKDTDRVVMDGPRLSAKVLATKDGIMIGIRELKMRSIEIVSDGKTKISVGGRIFRGSIEIIRKENGKLMLINRIALDDYLYGVLYHEVSHRWPMEVLKAQAIVARTFALFQARQNKNKPYDLRSDVYSQVYGGSTSERWSTTMAVNVTKGKVLVYDGDILPAYYHATCAGSTESASNLWKTDIGPLKGGILCDYCRISPHYKWMKEIPLWKVEENLCKGQYNIGKIASVSVLSRNSSGRVDKLEIKDDSGVSVILTGKDFRQLLGPNEIRSTKFDPSIKCGSLILEGYGWGHGVGMCQWGAFGMASQGKKAAEILQFYYPGTEIATIDQIRGRF
ncbi:MAG: SpoIID/LytB domain-containing protein [Candidatus Omnitrophica bacterium]|nr:SpoIID/LytB domain-containing protein [Candidatus Omnitrophota bacterium]